MSKISSLAQSALVVLIAGLGLLNESQGAASARTLSGLKGMPVAVATSLSKLNPTRIQADMIPELQASGQILSKLTSRTKDYLIAENWWQKQIDLTQNMSYDACLFGDSISSSLGNTLGYRTFNFAMGGMTTTSLVEQLKALTPAKVRCQTAIIAMGANDANSSITDDDFIKNLKTSISLVQGLGATKVFLIPAFYSTVEASHNPALAGSISRVEEINALIRQIAAMEKVVLFEEDIQPLYQGQSLRKELTIDGVHLNFDGQNLYRQALLKILSLPVKAGL
jgi:lysophospholipase L1-like esterase